MFNPWSDNDEYADYKVGDEVKFAIRLAEYTTAYLSGVIIHIADNDTCTIRCGDTNYYTRLSSIITDNSN